MLTVTDIRVRSLSTDYAYVAWRIEPTAEPADEYDFHVLRAESPSGPYEEISDALVDTFLWRDNTARDGRLWRDFYYRIRVTHRTSGDSAEFGSTPYKDVLTGTDPGGVSKDPEPSLIAREIIYRRRLMLRQYGGRGTLIFPVRTFGTRCQVCWDEVKRQRTRQTCVACFNTGFLGGFHRPILVYAQFRDHEHVQRSENMLREPWQNVFGISNFPVLKPRDVIVELENTRWRVDRTVPSKVQRAVVSQNAPCSRIIKRDSEYKLPVRGIDPIRFMPTDEREMAKPANLEAWADFTSRNHPQDF